MKKKLLLVGVILASSLSFGQTIFSENFDAALTLPTGWAQYNVDGKTPYSAGPDLSFMGTNAWIPTADNLTEVGNRITSISYYNPVGASNDWLVTPVIVIPATGYFLEYDVLAQDADFPDGYKVYVTTTGNTVADFVSAPIYTEAEGPNPTTTRSVDLSAYAGQSIYIAFRNDSNDKFVLHMDNILVRMPSANDAALVSSTLNRYSLVSTNNTLALSVKNDGTNTITSLTVDWNDGTAHSSVISCNIAAGATASINHPTAVSYATALEKNLSITITNVNGGTDPNMGNNVGSKAFNTVSALAEKNVLFEEGTGTWCGWCPRGAVAMKKAYLDHPTGFIGIAAHNGDAMTVAAYDAGCNFSGFPSANVDREDLGIDAGTADFDSYYASRVTMIPPAAISATITNSGAAYSIVASATFKTPYAAANLRLAAIITEDNVVGTGTEYNQANYYAGGGSGVMGGYETKPNPVLAADMVYPHVGRALLGGFSGQAGSVPTTITDGQVASYTFNYTVPSTSVLANMGVTILLIDQATGIVVNAKQYELSGAGISEVAKDIAMNVYPNPASDVLNVSFEATNGNYDISILDIAGRIVTSNNYTNLTGSQTIAVPVNGLVPGNYIVTIASEGVSYNQNVTIK